MAEYNDEINAILKQLDPTYSTTLTPEGVLKLSRKLQKYADQLKDDHLYGISYYYMAYSYYFLGYADKLMEAHTKTLKYLTVSEEPVKIISSYIFVGSVASSRTNTTLALDCFLKASDIAKQYKLRYYEGFVYSYIGQLYLGLSDYISALSYILKGCKFVETQTSFQNEGAMIANALLIACYTKLHDYNSAAMIIAQMDELECLTCSGLHSFVSAAALLRYYNDVSDDSNYRIVKDFLFKYAQEQSNLIDFHFFFKDICFLFLENRDDDSFIRFSTLIDSKLGDSVSISPYINEWLFDCRLHYYSNVGDLDGYYNALRGFFNAKQQQVGYSNEFSKHILNFRFADNELKRKHEKTLRTIEKLREKSEHDQLTSLHNFRFFKEHFEHTFDALSKRGDFLGLAILDIDYFKQYNDGYGHQAGDRAIVTVAKCLKKIESSSVQCFRYGGDEFLIVFTGMNDSEVIAVCQRLRKLIADSAITHAYSPISDRLTVSIGVRNSVPAILGKSWDFQYSADMALYDVKQFCKGGLQLVHHYLVPKVKKSNYNRIPKDVASISTQ